MSFHVGDRVRAVRRGIWAPSDLRVCGTITEMNVASARVRWDENVLERMPENGWLVWYSDLERVDPELSYLYKIRFKTIKEMLRTGKPRDAFVLVEFKTGMGFNEEMKPLCGMEDYVVKEEKDSNGNTILRLLGENPVVRRVLGEDMLCWTITKDMVKIIKKD